MGTLFNYSKREHVNAVVIVLNRLNMTILFVKFYLQKLMFIGV